MGILVRGVPLSWEDTKEKADYIREHGIQQFLSLMKTMNERYDKDM